MLKKKNRLSTKEFDIVFTNGKPIFSNYFIFKKVGTRGGSFKISVAVSKKVEKRAVDRVVTRRAIYRILKEKEVFFDGFWAVFLVKKSILSLGKEDLNKELEFVLKRAGIL